MLQHPKLKKKITHEQRKLRKKRRNFPGGLVVKSLGFCCTGMSLIPLWGTTIPHAMWLVQVIEIKKKIIHLIDKSSAKLKHNYIFVCLFVLGKQFLITPSPRIC